MDDPRPAHDASPAPGTALYVHLPFCVAKCHYCDFFSIALEGPDDPQVDRLVDAVLAEARRRAPADRLLAPRTVYLGGGTPSFLSADQLRRLLDGLHAQTGFRDSAVEVTAECNPESLDRDQARCLLDLGVDRLSIGFQSLREGVLTSFGRVHRVEDSFAAYEAARAAGATNVSVDLIFATPGQRPDEWEADLGRVLDLGPEHLSAYNLAFEEATPFKRWLDEGKLQPLPEEVELELFERTRELLAARGYAGYEVSNFALPDRHCAHNVNYWRNGQYLGLGPSAVSKVGWRRAGNVRAVQAYGRRAASPGGAEDWSETLEPAARLGETWWLGLRLAEGVDPEAARRRAGAAPDAGERALERARDLESGGLLIFADGRYRLTGRGLAVADAVAREFLDLARTGGGPAEALG